MPKQFEGFGISMLYPDSWNISEDPAISDERGVILESPEGAFISVNVYETDADPLEVVEEATEAMEAEYEDIESEPFDWMIGETELEGTIQRFYYLDFVVVSRIVALTHGDKVFLIQVQGEDRDIDRQEKVFEAIVTSMLRSLERA